MSVVAAFEELATCRNERGLIPWTAIREYAREAQIEDVPQFTRLIRVLDIEAAKAAKAES